MNTTNFAVVRRHYCERYTTEPHAYFLTGEIPITAHIVDEITIEITKKTNEVTWDGFVFPQTNKILKINVCGNGRLLDHEVLNPKQQQVDPKKLKWLNLEDPMKETIYPLRIRLDREYQVGERVLLTIETMTAFRTIPERKDRFLPSIDFEPISSTFSSNKYWPKKSNGIDSSISYVLPKGFKAVSMTSEGPDYISEFEGNSFVGWVFRGETYEYLRRWIVAQMSFLYFLLLYLVIPSSGLLIMIIDWLGIPVPPTIIAMLCGSYLVARQYLYDRTLMPLGGDIVIFTTLFMLLLSVFVVGVLDSILLTITVAVDIVPWIAFYCRQRDTKRNREKNDPYVRN